MNKYSQSDFSPFPKQKNNFATRQILHHDRKKRRTVYRKGTKAEYSVGLIGKLNLTFIAWTEPTSDEAKIIPGIIEEGIKK